MHIGTGGWWGIWSGCFVATQITQWYVPEGEAVGESVEVRIIDGVEHETGNRHTVHANDCKKISIFFGGAALCFLIPAFATYGESVAEMFGEGSNYNIETNGGSSEGNNTNSTEASFLQMWDITEKTEDDALLAVPQISIDTIDNTSLALFDNSTDMGSIEFA